MTRGRDLAPGVGVFVRILHHDTAAEVAAAGSTAGCALAPWNFAADVRIPSVSFAQLDRVAPVLLLVQHAEECDAPRVDGDQLRWCAEVHAAPAAVLDARRAGNCH